MIARDSQLSKTATINIAREEIVQRSRAKVQKGSRREWRQDREVTHTDS